MARTTIKIDPITPLIGAEIHGVDLSRKIDEETYTVIRQALLDYLVIILPDQQIKPEQQLVLKRFYFPFWRVAHANLNSFGFFDEGS